LTHGAGSTALITAGSGEWVLLSLVYHHVLAGSPSPEAAKKAVLMARANGQLRLRAEMSEHRARPNLTLEPGKRPRKLQPKCKPDQPILARHKLRHIDWERSYATRRDATTKSLFVCENIVGNRDDVLRPWPPAKMTVRAEIPETAVAKPGDVSRLVWAVIRLLDDIDKETPTGSAGLTQEQLTKKVSAKLTRSVSVRTLQKAVAFRWKRNQPP
jgi:hypothetical protein